MSLNRMDWIEMWNTIKELEREIKFDNRMALVKRQRIINKYINKIKSQIESVVGQME